MKLLRRLALLDLNNPVRKAGKEKFHSWMGPDGRIVQVNHSHNQQLRVSFPGKSLEEVFLAGWLRVTYFGATVYANNPYRKPNGIQKRQLINLAIENLMIKIVFDSDESERTIWESPEA